MPSVSKQRARVEKKVKAGTQSAWDLDSGIRMNLYGRSGTGKTTFWATFPKPILALICSGGKHPGELRSIDTPEYRKTINPQVLNSSEDLRYLIQAGDDYATVVLDHASGFQDLILKEILGLDEIPTQLSWGLASQQQYGQLAMQMKEHLRAVLSLPCNVVIVAQEREFNTEGTGDLLMPYVASALTPGVVGWLNPACDYICQTFIRQRVVMKEAKVGGKVIRTKVRGKGVEYCLRTGPDSVFTTKFRVPRGRELPEVVVDPTFEKIRSLIQGG